MFTAFRCYSGECISETGMPVALLLYQKSPGVSVNPYESDLYCGPVSCVGTIPPERYMVHNC